MPPAPEPTPRPQGSARVAPVSGRVVLFTVLAIGLTLVGGVATFAALTRPPRKPATPAEAASAPVRMNW